MSEGRRIEPVTTAKVPPKIMPLTAARTGKRLPPGLEGAGRR